jgi:hypothetical protein
MHINYRRCRRLAVIGVLLGLSANATGLMIALRPCDLIAELPLVAVLRLLESDPKQNYTASFAPI